MNQKSKWNSTNPEKNNQEYEIITHNSGNFRVFLVNLLYRTPHSHMDFEIGLILQGKVSLTFPGQESFSLEKGDFFVLNPYQLHEFSTKEPATILSLQIPPSFFSSYYPQIYTMEFSEHIRRHSDNRKLCNQIGKTMIDIAISYFEQESFGIIRCASLINQLFYTLFSHLPTVTFSENEKLANRVKGQRMRRIIHYVEDHYTEKILLSDIAREENLDLYYLSHFFAENFGIPFQKYLAKLRCEKARSLLLLTDQSLLDISLSLGFSDSKYFNKYFKELYGCTPKEYRIQFEALDLSEQQISMLSTQEFMSPKASLVYLAKQLENM